MKNLLSLLLLFSVAGLCSAADKKPSTSPRGSSYLFVWAGDDARTASDFLAVIDADPASPRYGRIVATAPTGDTGAMPHHTEYEFPGDGHLFANGFAGGRTYVFDLTQPLQPRIAARFTSRAGYGFAHSFARLPNGHVLATFQSHGEVFVPGGALVELDDSGKVIRSTPAADPALQPEETWPYSLGIAPKNGVAVTTLTPMGFPKWAKLPPGSWSFDKIDKQLTSHVQVWRLSDLALKKTIELPDTAMKDNRWPSEPRLLPDGSMLVGTFSCGLYRMTGLAGEAPAAEHIFHFPGFSDTDSMSSCGVPVVVGHYWIQTVGGLPGLIVLDVSNPAKPVEVSRLILDHRYHMPHWMSADRHSDRIVITGDMEPWVLVARLDQKTGKLTLDDRFHDAGSSVPGIRFEGAQVPGGRKALVHGALFGQ